MAVERPGVGLAVVLIRDGKLLLGKRKGEHGEGTYGFPGGHLEHGESWEACAVRECEEETGLTPHNLRFWTATNDIFDTGKHYITLFMCGEVQGNPRILEPEKCEEWIWMRWEEVPENAFLPIRNLKKSGYNPFKTV